MKKITLLFLLLFFSFAIAQKYGDIIISEIYFDTPYEENIAVSNNEFTHIGEFIELFNSSTADIDISDWTIRDDNQQIYIKFPAGRKIKSGRFLVVAYNPALAYRATFNQDSDYFKILFPTESNNNPTYSEDIYYHNKILLYDKFENVRLYDSNGDLRYSIKYRTVNSTQDANVNPNTPINPLINSYQFSTIRHKDNDIAVSYKNEYGKRVFNTQNLRAIPLETKTSIQVTDSKYFNSDNSNSVIVWQELEATPFGLPQNTNIVLLPPAINLSNNLGTNYIYICEPTIETEKITYSTPKIHQITYFDGLGRETQNININASTDGKDIINHIEYDQYGRKSKEYLPYASSSNSGGALLSSTSALSDTNNYYKSNYPNDFINITNPYTEKIYEDNPNSLILETSTPGEEWVYNNSNVSLLSGLRVSTNHTNKINYLTNQSSDGIIKYEVGFTSDNRLQPYLVSGTYSDNELIKTISYNENWNSSQTNIKDNTIEEFKNKSGKTILTRSYLNNIAQDTYFVYDLFGNLTYVIPPKASVNSSITVAILNGLCYQYKYDKKNRLVEKRLPDQDGWHYMVYDKQNRLVASQDPNLSNQNKWAYNKYDKFGRVVYTGVVSNSSNRTTLQSTVDLLGTNNESIITGGAIFGYSNIAFPVGLAVNDVYSVNYYDSYPISTPMPTSNSVESQDILTNLKGLSTAIKRRTVSDIIENTWTDSYYFYDKFSRPIRTQVNNYLGGYKIIDSKLDFRGKVLYTIAEQKKDANSTKITIKDNYEFDKQERLLAHKQTIDTQPEERIKENIYDKIGSIKGKKVGGLSTKTELQNINYKYNIRGWLLGINDTNNLGNSLFGYKLTYNKPDVNYLYTKQYNGGISQSWSKIAGDNNLRGYAYNYDGLNRLKDAFSYKNSLINTASEKNINYDQAGNITSLYRSGGDDNISIDMDLLAYTYYDNSNRLKSVTDGVNNTNGFKDVAGIVDYEYDYNGNLKKDNNKSITSVQYNFMDLPVLISFANGNWIKYKYSSDGNKISKIVKNGTVTTTTDYLSGFQYKQGILQFFPHEEGYVYKDGTDYKYVYNYTDHLGNVRVAYQDKNGDGAVTSTEILEQNSYYPFGLKQLGFGTQNYTPTDYKIRYSGKEFQDELGLDMYDFGARNYMPDIARWGNIDPLASKFSNLSPYNYVGNNPLSFVDPDGKSPIDFIQGLWNGIYKGNGSTYTSLDIFTNSIYGVFHTNWRSQLRFDNPVIQFYKDISGIGFIEGWMNAALNRNAKGLILNSLGLLTMGIGSSSERIAGKILSREITQGESVGYFRFYSKTLSTEHPFYTNLKVINQTERFGEEFANSALSNISTSEKISTQINSWDGASEIIRQDYAFGLKNNLKDFSNATGYSNYGSFLKTAGLNNQINELEAIISSPSTNIHFNLQGISGLQYSKFNLDSGVNYGNITNWELKTIYNTPGALDRTTFYRYEGGNYYPTYQPSWLK